MIRKSVFLKERNVQHGVVVTLSYSTRPGQDLSYETVLAFRADNGKALWRYETNRRLPADSTLAVQDHVVYIVSDDHVYALRIGDGRLLWQNDGRRKHLCLESDYRCHGLACSDPVQPPACSRCAIVVPLPLLVVGDE